MLLHLCADSSVKKAIIFSATRRDADNLARDLNRQGYTAAALHGDMSQNARNRTMLNMRRGRIRLLVATDVAARGRDVTGISHVINFDLPRLAEDYVNRIGRTGRAGESGVAISFASQGELPYLDRIERYIGQILTMHVIPGLEPTHPLRKSNGNRDDALLKGLPVNSSRQKNGRSARPPINHSGSNGSVGNSPNGRRRTPRWHKDVTVVYRSSHSDRPGRATSPKADK
jgi:superfamily II DNA/RNA helicase